MQRKSAAGKGVRQKTMLLCYNPIAFGHTGKTNRLDQCKESVRTHLPSKLEFAIPPRLADFLATDEGQQVKPG
jgi:hypothetical protein